MRHLRQFCAVTMLVCALAFSAYAGNIECDILATSPQPTTSGEIECPGITDMLLIMLALV